MSTKPKPGIVVFPASNCDQDMKQVLKEVFGLNPAMLWHEDEQISPDITHLILPGGFSYGDYLRAGAIASHAKIMRPIKKLAQAGLPLLGICNGFQILCEAKLLPGTLLKNHHDRFVCRKVDTKFYGNSATNQDPIAIKLPIAHREGRYYATASELRKLNENSQIVLRYQEVDDQGNALVNGSCEGIAGIVSGPSRNIMGMMPHPERMTKKNLSRREGCLILQEFLFG